VKELREREMEIARWAEAAYDRFVGLWEPRLPRQVRGRLKPAGLR
jgi:hypothetical protein